MGAGFWGSGFEVVLGVVHFVRWLLGGVGVSGLGLGRRAWVKFSDEESVLTESICGVGGVGLDSAGLGAAGLGLRARLSGACFTGVGSGFRVSEIPS